MPLASPKNLSRNMAGKKNKSWWLRTGGEEFWRLGIGGEDNQFDN